MLVTPVEMTKVSTRRVADVAEVIKTVASEMDIEVIDCLKEVDIRRDVELQRFTNTTDGVHTSPEGAAMIARAIAERFTVTGEKQQEE